jgi:hypothetical protein
VAIVTRQSDVEAVDSFLAAGKRLGGEAPEFGPTNFSRKGAYENCARWPLVDELGIAIGAEFLFVARARGEHSVSVLWRQRPICRLDIVASNECKSNPYFARDFNLPARVCGSHFHAWEHSRAHILSQHGWELPCREPLPPQIRRFEQAWLWLADRLHLVLSVEERSFELPEALI